MASRATPHCFWGESELELFERLGATRRGLAAADAARRLAQYGRNSAEARQSAALAMRVLRKLGEPLVAILLVAALVAGATGDLHSVAIIFTVVVLSTALDVLQEQRAESAAEALRHAVAVRADVRRDDSVVAIPVEQVVPGDIVELRAGDLVPADGILIEGRSTHVNEALLTGEPYPVEKRPGLCAATTPAEAFNALFSGTSVVSGEATMLVCATGRATRIAGIAASLAARKPPTTFELGVHRLGLLILRLTVALVLLVLLARLSLGRPVLESFLFAVALAVGLTPELLPMVTTVTLARGALRMARKQVIVKRLAAIHDLGAMDVLCTDKTGTLTEARISLVAYPGPDGTDNDHVLTLAAVNARFDIGIRSPLDAAILNRAEGHGGDSWRKIDDLPFDFERRRASVLVERNGRRLLVIKGAPEGILAATASLDRGDGTARPIDEAARAALLDLHDRAVARGHRLLAVAWKAMPDDCTAVEPRDETDLVMAGFCEFADPPKASAAAAIARLASAGVRVKVLSGDHEAVVRQLVLTLGLPSRELLTGQEIAALTDAALLGRVEAVDLYARLSPDQKTRIIRALRARGHTVGFLGDGVNDAPAIHAADVGLSVENATDVARAAADMILLAPELGILADGVAEGRQTFSNILKYIRMGTSSNFGNMLSMALASLVLPFLPLTPVQILLNNLLYDLSEIGIPFDRVDRDDLATPHAWDMGAILRFTLIMGGLSSLFDMITFAMLLKLFDASPALFQTAWFAESMATQILVIFAIRTHGHAWMSRAHPALVATSLCALGAALTIVLSPLGRVFGFVPLPGVLLATVGAIVIAYLACAEHAKRWSFRFAWELPPRRPPD